MDSFKTEEGIVFTKLHGVACLLDVFVPDGKRNGLGVVHTMNGGWHSNESTVEHFRDDLKIYDNFCACGFVVFSVWTGSCKRFTCDDMVSHLKLGVQWIQKHSANYKIDPDRLALMSWFSGNWTVHCLV